MLSDLNHSIPGNLQGFEMGISELNESLFSRDQQIIFEKKQQRQKQFVQKFDPLHKELVNNDMLN